MTLQGENDKLYRDILRCFNRYSTTANRISTASGYPLSGIDLQVMELLLENERKQLMMAEIAAILGVPISTFTKIVAKLTQLGLAEKYHRDGNRKSIIVLLSEKGKAFFQQQQLGPTQDWIGEFHNLIQERPERAAYYEELLGFFLRWMETGDSMIDEHAQKSKLIPIPSNER